MRGRFRRQSQLKIDAGVTENKDGSAPLIRQTIAPRFRAFNRLWTTVIFRAIVETVSPGPLMGNVDVHNLTRGGLTSRDEIFLTHMSMLSTDR